MTANAHLDRIGPSQKKEMENKYINQPTKTGKKVTHEVGMECPSLNTRL
jgi:hypothetical protein